MLHEKTIDHLLTIHEIYHEPDVYEYARGSEILSKYPDAKLIEVKSHNQIPELFGFAGAVENWLWNKKNVLILGTKHSLSARPNTRSSHWVAPSQSNGCTMSCSYCYVPRRKGYANPITIFVNIERIMGYLERHAGRQGKKLIHDQIDPEYWVYEIGENGDCSADAAICDNVKDLVHLFRRLPNAKLTFATKFVNRELLDYNPQHKTRIRFSLMPHQMSKLVDVRTTPISDRIAVMNEFRDAGYEVNVSFAPVIYYDGWLDDWRTLLEELNDTLDEPTKRQLATEIIFLTHNQQLHDVNMDWHPKAEEVLWRPDIQQVKYSQTGQRNVRYKNNLKRELVNELVNLCTELIPYCAIRYAF
ncbi:spore photoproduct lyase family protein [Mucilaginibacter limnophilus]|uniref:Spore photoproduct lyase family protein n=1 Tax=Mucilaginibacter limnophilus TaxID=1932778 RepID=A0A437MYY5_9SPHI|nr:spore photoproduct lyase family protein [Mucilaginibacter limnophilus]RVU02885.1 spore photoproduct lyase family protein [Mucilaginibacter limnophilus]